VLPSDGVYNIHMYTISSSSIESASIRRAMRKIRLCVLLVVKCHQQVGTQKHIRGTRTKRVSLAIYGGGEGSMGVRVEKKWNQNIPHSGSLKKQSTIEHDDIIVLTTGSSFFFHNIFFARVNNRCTLAQRVATSRRGRPGLGRNSLGVDNENTQ
jgi:hypothetical protein